MYIYVRGAASSTRKEKQTKQVMVYAMPGNCKTGEGGSQAGVRGVALPQRSICLQLTYHCPKESMSFRLACLLLLLPCEFALASAKAVSTSKSQKTMMQSRPERSPRQPALVKGAGTAQCRRRRHGRPHGCGHGDGHGGHHGRHWQKG